MQSVLPNQSNVIGLPLVRKLDGNPITSGIVNFYLVRLDTNKWFRGTDQSWQDNESIAGEGIHRADGHWYTDLPDVAWIANTRYTLYAKESENLHIPVGEEISCGAIPVVYGNIKKIYTVKDNVGNPIEGVDVWVTTDQAGDNVVASGVTDLQGEVEFWLDSGVYYIWSQKGGYSFTNPDTETVP